MSTATTTRQDGCKANVSRHARNRIDDIKRLWAADQAGEDSDLYKETEKELGRFNEYGLSFDYVAPGTFNGQRRGYFRYQISWGGPSEEFRFFCDENKKCVRVEFWFLDWFDGAKKILAGDDEKLMTEIFDFFDEIGSVQAEYNKATNE
jgi:hypothetical protein